MPEIFLILKRIQVKALRYYSDGPGIDSRWCHWIFQWHIPSDRTMALGSTQPLVKMSTGTFPEGKGGRCVKLTSPPSCAEYYEIWEPKPSGTLWTTPGLLWDCFTFKKNSEKYGRRCTQIITQCPRFSCQILTKLEFFSQIFEKSWNLKFYESPSIGRRVLSREQRDGEQVRLTERLIGITKLTFAFRNFRKHLRMRNGNDWSGSNKGNGNLK